VPLARKIGKATSRKTGDEEEGRPRHGEDGEQDVLWEVGEDSDEGSGVHLHAEDEDPDVDHHQNPIQTQHRPRGSAASLLDKGDAKGKGKGKSVDRKVRSWNEEGVELIGQDDEDGEEDDNGGKRSHRPQNGGISNPGSSPDAKPADPFRDDDEFGDWEGVGPKR